MAEEKQQLTGGLGWPMRIATAFVLAGVIVFLLWTAGSLGTPEPFRGQRSDYYNLLVDGFLDGHLHMKVTPDPGLGPGPPLASVKPDARFLLDASYYRGKYYLYFGVTPALTLFLPWTVLSGHDLPEWFAVGILASLMFLAGALWLWVLRREFFPQVSGPVWLATALAFGLGTGLPVAVRPAKFYQVAAFSGGAWMLTGLVCLTLAVTRRRLAWLALGSVCVGLASGSRPTLVPGGVLALVVVVAWLWRDSGSRQKLLVAGFGPVVALGVALAWYNWARFDNPFEFGLHFQLGSNANGFAFTLESLWRNLRVYYFTPPDTGYFFPFFAPGPKPAGSNPEEAHGMFLFLPLFVLLAGAGARALWQRKLPARLAIVGVAAALWAGVSFLIVASAPNHSDRYALDFHPAAAALALLGALASSTAGVPLARWLGRAALAWMGLVSLHGVMTSLQIHGYLRDSNPATYAAVGRACDRVAWPFFRLTRPEFGGVELRVTFPAAVPGTVEPLLIAGSGTEVDGVLVHYTGVGRARLVFDHQGAGSFSGPEFSLRPGEPRTLVLHLGTLCPPEWHPWYDSLPAGAVRLGTHVRASLDGVELLAFDAPCYRASPNQVAFGRRRGFLYGEQIFHGQIELIREAGPDLEWLAGALAETGAVRLRVGLPQDRFGTTEPLLFSGDGDRYDLVCVRYDDPRTLRVGVQHAGWPFVKFSSPLAVDYGAPHEFEIELGSLAPGAWLPADQLDSWRTRGATVRLDGRTILTERFDAYPAAAWQQVVGCTPFLLSTSRRLYGGPLEILPRAGVTETELAAALRARRPLELRLRFPVGRTGAREPLVTTGVTGAGDSLYVRYLDAGHVAFGFDHWGVGGTESAPVAIDFDAEQVLVIGFGALLPPDDRGRARLRVTLNGVVVVDAPQAYHLAGAAQARIGVNHIGLSTSEPVFTGEISSVTAR